MSFIYQCINRGVKIILLTRHSGDIEAELRHYRLEGVFDDVIHLEQTQSKHSYITEHDAIFIDDSFGERQAVKEKCNIPVFDTHMIECLLEE